MKTKRILSCLLLALLLVSLSSAALAEPVFVSDDSPLTGEYDATAFVAGKDPSTGAIVHGILFAAGNNVNAGGSCEYAFVAGNQTSFSAACEKDAFVAGKDVVISGKVGRDLAAAGSTLVLSGSVGGDVYAGGSKVTVSGSIGGNVTLSAEEIRIDDGAEIGGTLRYNSSAKITAPAAILSRAETYEEKSGASEADSVPVSGPSPLAKVKSWLFGYLGLVLLAFALLWLTPLWEKLDSVYTGAPFGKYAAAFGIGWAVLAGLPLAALILMITGIGLRVGFVLALLYAAAMIASPVIFGFFIGVLLWRGVLKQKRSYYAELAAGLLVWRVLSLIPRVSIFTGLVVIPLALGVFTLLPGKKKPAPVLPEAVQ